MTTPQTGPSVPLLDLGRWERATPVVRQRVAGALANSLEQVGFLVLDGHGVRPEVTGDLVAAAREFFALDVDEKMAVHRLRGGDPGYYPPASSRLAQSLGMTSPPDLKEGFGVAPLVRGTGAPFEGPDADRWFPANRWPTRPAGLRVAAELHFTTMTGLADRLLRVLALGLGLPETWFEQWTSRHTSTASVLHYPPQRVPPEPGQLRAGAHTDYGTLTILHKAGDARGLQVQLPDGTWLPVTPGPGQLVVNIGDLMSTWTGGRWASTMHRVVNPPMGVDQPGDISLPFFHQPDWDAVVSPVGREGQVGVLAGRHLADKVDRMHAVAGA